MKTVVRRPNKTKAVVCLGAAVAVLVGGASTFARWAQDAELLLTSNDDSPAITAGNWDLTGAVLAADVDTWYDTSVEVYGAAYASNIAANCSDSTSTTKAACVAADETWTGWTGNKWATGLTSTAYGTPATWKAMHTTNANGGGLVITLANFRVVPGDQLTGIFTFDADKLADDVDLVGEHLKVTIGAIDASGAKVTIDDNDKWLDPVTAKVYGPAQFNTISTAPEDCTVTDGTDGCFIAKNQVAVVIDYAWDEAGAIYSTSSTDTLPQMKMDYCVSRADYGDSYADAAAATLAGETGSYWDEDLETCKVVTSTGDTMDLTTDKFDPTPQAAGPLIIEDVVVTLTQTRP